MSKMGDGYGSEYHLNCWAKNRPDELGRYVQDAIAVGNKVEWWGFPFDMRTPPGEREWRGVEFVQDHPCLHRAWKKFWPSTGNTLNWDAIAKLHTATSTEWLLIEAKASIEEMRSGCQAKECGGRPQIRNALGEVKRALGAAPEADWLGDYYQYANRLACLWFLAQHGVPARLVYIYFLGDEHHGATCPKTEAEWEEPLLNQQQALELAAKHPLAGRTHRVYVVLPDPEDADCGIT